MIMQQRLNYFVPYIVIGIILIILPPLMPSYLQTMMVKILIFSIYAMSLDLLFGYTGLFSLGHAAFFGVGGYTTGILATRLGIESFWLTAPLSVLVATGVAAIFGLIALRMSGLYFMMVTFALGQLLVSIATQWFHVTGGAFGLKRIPLPMLGIPGFSFSVINQISLYYFVFLFFVACLLLLRKIVESPFGYTLRGIREHEPRMLSLGYNTWLYKYLAFIIAGSFAGVAGCLFAHWNMLISPRHLGIVTSSLGLFFIIIGGPGTIFGSIIGTAIIIGTEYASSLYAPERWELILGLIFVVTVMFLRGGIYPHLVSAIQKVHFLIKIAKFGVQPNCQMHD